MNVINNLLPSVLQNNLVGTAADTYGAENNQKSGEGNTTLASIFNNAAMRNTQASSLSLTQVQALSQQVTEQVADQGYTALTGNPGLRDVAQSVLQERPPEPSQEMLDKIAEVAASLNGGASIIDPAGHLELNTEHTVDTVRNKADILNDAGPITPLAS